MSSPRIKNIFVFVLPKSDAYPSRPVPQEGRSRVVTSAGRDAVDAAVSGDGRAGRKARELTNGTRTNGAVARRSLWRRRVRGRQSRVVLAPVAGVKFAEERRPDRASTNLNPRMTVTRRIRRRGCRGACHRAALRA